MQKAASLEREQNCCLEQDMKTIFLLYSVSVLSSWKKGKIYCTTLHLLYNFVLNIVFVLALPLSPLSSLIFSLSLPSSIDFVHAKVPFAVLSIYFIKSFY